MTGLAALITSASSLLAAVTGMVVLLRKTDKLATQSTRIEHLVNSQLDDVTSRLAEVERELAVRTRERDDAEREVPGARQAREGEREGG